MYFQVEVNNDVPTINNSLPTVAKQDIYIKTY